MANDSSPLVVSCPAMRNVMHCARMFASGGRPPDCLSTSQSWDLVNHHQAEGEQNGKGDPREDGRPCAPGHRPWIAARTPGYDGALDAAACWRGSSVLAPVLGLHHEPSAPSGDSNPPDPCHLEDEGYELQILITSRGFALVDSWMEHDRS
jgi:hypothetical protein